MSDGGRGRASLAVKVWKSSQKWSAQRSAVRSIVWLDVSSENHLRLIRDHRGESLLGCFAILRYP